MLITAYMRLCSFRAGFAFGFADHSKPSGEEGRRRVLIFNSNFIFITAKPCLLSCWVCLAAVFTEPSLAKPSEEGERNPC